MSQGAIAYLPAAGDACLAAATDAGCDAPGFASVNNRCDDAALYLGQTAVGGPCDLSTDCLIQDAGPVTGSESAPGCNLAGTQVCAGVCSLGLQVGEPCGNQFLSLSCGAGQGSCQVVEVLVDGGPGGEFCVPFASDGQPCNDTDVSYVCNGLTQYCADAGGASYVCAPHAASGSPCDPAACSFPAQCLCPASEVCIGNGVDGGGTCGPLGQHVACAPVGDFPCGIDSYCDTLYLADGGAPRVCERGNLGLGAICDSADECADGLVCSDSVAGTCVFAGNVGERCDISQASPCVLPGLVYCPFPTDGGEFSQCAVEPSVGQPCTTTDESCGAFAACEFLSDGGTTCLRQELDGAPCDTSISQVCSNGYCQYPSDGGTVGTCVPTISFGQPCDVTESVACGADGYCYAIPDGGGICNSSICAD